MPKSGLEQWHVIGPVRALSRSTAEWDAMAGSWTDRRQFVDVLFRRDGQIEETTYHNTDGAPATTVYQYDAEGRLIEAEERFGAAPGRHIWYERDGEGHLTAAYEAQGNRRRLIESVTRDAGGARSSVVYLPGPVVGVDPCYGVEGSEMFYNVPGAVTQTTFCDAADRPLRVEFHDDVRELLSTIEFTRDARGHIVREESRFTGEVPPHMRTAGSTGTNRRQEILDTLRAAFAGNIFLSMTFDRDESGRVVSSTRRHGMLAEDRSDFTYDTHGNVIEQINHDSGHSLGPDETGAIVARNHRDAWWRTRFEYVYDDRGNWTERIACHGIGTEGEIRRTNVEWRRISYWTE